MKTTTHTRLKSLQRLRSTMVAVVTLATLCANNAARATESALGRPVTGTSVMPSVGIVPDVPVWIVSLQQLYLDGTISGSRNVPVGGKTSLGLDGEVAFTLATLIKVWGGSHGWDFASGVTLPYVWENATATFSVNQASKSVSDRVSNLYDMYFTPILAGYHFSANDHIALSFNVWAPTGNYEAGAIANPSLNNWTFVPQIAYTHLAPKYGLEFDAVMGFQFYTRNPATNYQNAPLFTLDVMGLKKFLNGVGVGLVMGTTQQMGNDTGPIPDRINGFVGHDVALGPIVTYEMKLGGKAPLTASMRWVPSIASTNRLKSTKTFMATATLVF